ncbi:MAG TPA: hypothetical protein VKT28_00525 [Puia sp.]|nr:hypothetical protein [Puia sp.]
MGLKDFLKQQGFIKDDDIKKDEPDDAFSQKTDVAPVIFPVQNSAATETGNTSQGEPSFVVAPSESITTNSTTNKNEQAADPSFIKFFEDELAKANLPGPDYFEFRQLLIKTQQKMATKGVVAPEVVLQTVLMSFEAQDVPASKLIDAAKHYKEVIKQKRDDFLNGAANEKNNQLQKRQTVLQTHNENIQKIEQQLQQLAMQKQQLDAALNKEKTQMDVDKTLGQEGIQKIERAERLIGSAHDYMQSIIDNDIKRLQSL